MTVDERIKKFCDDAEADNWKIVEEEKDKSFRLHHPEGFQVLIFSSLCIAIVPLIAVWGPDHLNIYYPSSEYDLSLMKKNMRCCTHCKKYVDYILGSSSIPNIPGFAGRVCEECYKSLSR